MKTLLAVIIIQLWSLANLELYNELAADLVVGGFLHIFFLYYVWARILYVLKFPMFSTQCETKGAWWISFAIVLCLLTQVPVWVSWVAGTAMLPIVYWIIHKPVAKCYELLSLAAVVVFVAPALRSEKQHQILTA